MRNCKSRLGEYIWEQRSNRGIKRTELAQMVGCEREFITLIEQSGDDDEGILPRLIEVLELNVAVIERRRLKDKRHRRRWLKHCSWRRPPTIQPARATPSFPVEVPAVVVGISNDAVEEFARDFARDWNQTVELFVQNHIRFVISPTGEMDITELGYPEPWLDDMAEL